VEGNSILYYATSDGVLVFLVERAGAYATIGGPEGKEGDTQVLSLVFLFSQQRNTIEFCVFSIYKKGELAWIRSKLI